MLALLKRLSFRHLRAAPLRSALVVLGIALGVAVMVASYATSDGMIKSFDELVQRIAGRADLMVVGSESGIPSSLTADIAAAEGVEHAAAALEVNTSFADDGQALLILGVDFLGDTHFLPFESKEGEDDLVDDPLSFINDPNAVLVTRTLAERRGLREGSEIEVLSADASGVTELEVRGILEDTGPASSFGGQVAVMFIDTAQIAFARGRLVDRIDVALAQDADAEVVAQKLEHELRGRAMVDKPSQVGRRMRWLAEPLEHGLRMSGIIALLVGIFIIYNAIGISVAHRRREIGVLRALGVLRRGVVAHFCLEACLLSVLGVLLGLVLARELVPYTYLQTQEAMSRMYNATSLEPPPVGLRHAMAGGILGFVITLAAAFLPARQGAQLDPVAALRGNAGRASERSLPHARLALLGVVVLAAAWAAASHGSTAGAFAATGLTLIGTVLFSPSLVVWLRRVLLRPVHAAFGIAGRLGLDYVQRSLGRSTINVLSLMVAVTFSVAVSGWLTSFEHSVRQWLEQVTASDLSLSAGSPLADRRRMQLAPDTPERLEGIEGLSAVQPMRIIDQRRGEVTMRLVASDTKTYLEQAYERGKSWQVLDGHDPIAPGSLREAPRIVLSENAAVGLGLSAGDHMTLSTPSGPLDVEIWSVVVDYTADTGAFFIDREVYKEHWGDPAIDVIHLYVADGADSAQVAERVRERMKHVTGLYVTETDAVREQFFELLEGAFAYTQAFELIVLLIALLGVVGTMVAGVLDRTREIGMLRAVGATRPQVTLAIVLEAAFLGLCGVCGGILSGVVLCVLFLDTLMVQFSGWHLDFVFPAQGALRIAVTVIATAAVAGLLPGLRGARLEIKDALANE